MVRAVASTVAPPSARRPAMAAPIPFLPPVTSARRPASESLMVTGMAGPSCPACPSLLGPCRRRLVADDDQPHDAVVADREVAGEDERVRQPGLVVLAIGHGVDDHLPVVPGGGGGVHRHLVADDLAVEPGPDRVLAPELAAGVVDEGVIGEPADQRVAVPGVARVDVHLDRRRQVNAHVPTSSLVAADTTVGAPPGGEPMRPRPTRSALPRPLTLPPRHDPRRPPPPPPPTPSPL